MDRDNCPVCPALREQISMLTEMLRAEREEKHGVLQQLINLADPLAIARMRAPQPVKPGEKRDPPVLSPSIARATQRDVPSPEEIARFEPVVGPAADRRDIEASFKSTGT